MLGKVKSAEILAKSATEDDYTLFNEFMLNEIKAKEDTMKQLISVSVLLIGAYTTIILSLASSISSLLPGPSRINNYPDSLPEWIGAAIVCVGLVAIFIFPPLIWYEGIRNMIKGFKPIKSINGLLDHKNSGRLLIEINDGKYKKLRIGSDNLLGGLGVSGLIVITMLLSQIFFYLVHPQ